MTVGRGSCMIRLRLTFIAGFSRERCAKEVIKYPSIVGFECTSYGIKSQHVNHFDAERRTSFHTVQLNSGWCESESG